MLQPSLKLIVRVVAEEYGLRILQLTGENRVASVARARHVAMYIARELTDESFPSIGRQFGGKDHTTVIAACKKIRERLQIESALVLRVDAITKRIRAMMTLPDPESAGLCPHCARPYIGPSQREEAAVKLRAELDEIGEHVLAFARAS